MCAHLGNEGLLAAQGVERKLSYQGLNRSTFENKQVFHLEVGEDVVLLLSVVLLRVTRIAKRKMILL